MVADRVTQAENEENTYVVTIDDGHGILDGGNTYELITRDREEELPSDQYVKFEVLTNIPEEWLPEIARGLNTSVLVQPMSLDHLAGHFNWIKQDLAGEAYFGRIAWRENEPGEFDARDIVSMLTCFNIDLFPNDSDGQPVMAYDKKSEALKLFEGNEGSYKKLRPLLKDILILHDTIRCDSRTFWNEAGGKFGSLAFVEPKKRGEFIFPFTGKTSKYRLMNGALYPMLAAFRWMVEENSRTGKFRWRRGGFAKVIQRWEGSAAELMRMTATASNELGRNPNAIGKSRNHWANLHARVAMRHLMEKAPSP